MKIRQIEIQENYLVSYEIDKSTYNSATYRKVTQWRLILKFRIPDDFSLYYDDHIEINYTEFDFDKDIVALDNYIELLKAQLDALIVVNRNA